MKEYIIGTDIDVLDIFGGGEVKLTGILTNDRFNEEIMTNMEYYYHRGNKYYFRNCLGKLIVKNTDIDISNLKFKNKYTIKTGG